MASAHCDRRSGVGRAEATPRQVAANVETATTATPPIRTLFMLEAAVNAVSGPLMIIAPRLVLMAEEEHIVSDEAAELGRWFGCMVFAFGAVLLGRALRAGRSCSNCSLEMYATRHAPIFGWGGLRTGQVRQCLILGLASCCSWRGWRRYGIFAWRCRGFARVERWMRRQGRRKTSSLIASRRVESAALGKEVTSKLSEKEARKQRRISERAEGGSHLSIS